MRAAVSVVDRSHVPPRRVLEARKRLHDAVRRWFDARGFLEVETPIAVPSPGLEPHLEAFATEAVGPDRAAERLYLHTSPEYAMKRLLGRGVGSIYQLARVFRNGERSRTHAPEFTMLEWYRAPGTLAQLMDDTEALIAEAAAAIDGPWRPARAVRLSVSEAFLRAGLVDPLEHPDTDDLRRGLGVRAVEGDGWDDVFFRAFLDRVEPGFEPDAITTIWGWPASMAALARLDPADPRRAERFETYLGPLELANAFGELTDPVEQRRRFEADLAARRAAGAPCYPIDEGLLADLGAIGEAAGIALGVDRLLMRALDLPSIQDVIPFSPRDPAPEVRPCRDASASTPTRSP
jgi:lysyl-tRNA synthetase class 2